MKDTWWLDTSNHTVWVHKPAKPLQPQKLIGMYLNGAYENILVFMFCSKSNLATEVHVHGFLLH